MNKAEIEQNLIFLFTRGSQAYGTNTPESDEDIGGICLPSRNVIYGINKFEQDDNWVDENGEKVDKTIYGLNKAIELLLQSNPNMLDFLYAPERCIKYETDEWVSIRDIRDDFLSIKAKWTFQGYAVSQLNRIETHRGYLLNPVDKPLRENFGLPEKSIFPETQIEVLAKISSQWVNPNEQDTFFSEMSRLMDSEGSLIFKKYIEPKFYPIAIEDYKKRQKEFLRMISSVSQYFLKDEYIDVAQKELSFISAVKSWESYKRWKQNRNPKRKEIEARSGFDCKHASHLIRLLKMSTEILSGKGVLVDRTNIDREYLLDIRNGKYTFEQVLEESNKLNKEADELYKTTKLAKKPNLNKINELRMDILERHLWKQRKEK